MKNCLIFLFIIFLLASIAGFSIFYWYSNAITLSNGISTEKIVFEVKSGESLDTIADNLVSAGILKDKWAFWFHGKLNPDYVNKFQAGYFELSPQNTVIDLFVLLQKAKNKDDVRITIVEGLRADEIAEVIAEEYKNLSSSKFDENEFMMIVNKPMDIEFSKEVGNLLNAYKPEEATLEGFLFPDTYFFSKDADARDVIEKMIITLFDRIKGDDYTAVTKSDYTFFQILTLASLIEREALTNEEKPMIADILYKRLQEGINGVRLLQVDATLLYIAKDWKADAYRLKESEDPYNTYKYQGLPPGPICNPGLEAIEGAIFPESNDYFFYIHDASGKVHYAKTYADHLINVDMYL
jgi:UPF0755 protein